MSSRTGTAVRRVTTSLRDPDVSNLQEVSGATRLSENDAIRKALATEAFVQETLQNGGRILVEDKDGNIRQVAFVG